MVGQPMPSRDSFGTPGASDESEIGASVGTLSYIYVHVVMVPIKIPGLGALILATT